MHWSNKYGLSTDLVRKICNGMYNKRELHRLLTLMRVRFTGSKSERMWKPTAANGLGSAERVSKYRQKWNNPLVRRWFLGMKVREKDRKGGFRGPIGGSATPEKSTAQSASIKAHEEALSRRRDSRRLSNQSEKSSGTVNSSNLKLKEAWPETVDYAVVISQGCYKCWRNRFQLKQLNCHPFQLINRGFLNPCRTRKKLLSD